MKPPPKGIYLAAVVFFLAGLVSAAAALSAVFTAVGFPPLPSPAQLTWILGGYLLALFLTLIGVALIVRLHRTAPWLMLAVATHLTLLLLTTAVDSPFYSPSRIWTQRVLISLVLIANTAYLFRLRGQSEFS